MTFVFTIAASTSDGILKVLTFFYVLRDIRHGRYAITMTHAVRPDATRTSQSDHVCTWDMMVGCDTVKD
jgi:hypothetical protein